MKPVNALAEVVKHVKTYVILEGEPAELARHLPKDLRPNRPPRPHAFCRLGNRTHRNQGDWPSMSLRPQRFTQELRGRGQRFQAVNKWLDSGGATQGDWRCSFCKFSSRSWESLEAHTKQQHRNEARKEKTQ